MGQTISFKRPDGQSVQGYLAEPAGGSGPGVVVIQEWWGLNAQIRGVADRMAGAGYRALVPDLYRGKVTVEAKEAEHLMTNLNFGDAAGQDVRGGGSQRTLSALRRRHSTAQRYPGGNFASGYHWLDGVGPRPRADRARPGLAEPGAQPLRHGRVHAPLPDDGLDADDHRQPGHGHARRGAQLGRVLQRPAGTRTPTCAPPTAPRTRTPSSSGAWATRWTAPGSWATCRPTSTPSAPSRRPR